MLAVALVFALAPPAHADSVSVATITIGRDALRLVLAVDADRLMEVCRSPPPLGEEWTPAEIAAVAERAYAYVGDRWRLRSGGRDVALAPESIAPGLVRDPATGRDVARRVELRFRLDAARDAPFELTETLFEELEPSHHHFVVLSDGGDPPLADFGVLGAVPCRFFLPDSGEGATGRRLRARALAGARAAVAAPWLLAFLVALVAAPLAAGRRPAAAFLRTSAVPSALGAAAFAFAIARLGWIEPAPWAARAAAAFAPVYLALENRRRRGLELRFATALLFGLVQGMALATEMDSIGRIGGAPADGAFLVGKLVTAAALAALLAATVGRLRRGPLALDVAALATGATGVALAVWPQIRP
jgi:hypothetical protein